MNPDCPQFHRVVGCDVAKQSVTLHDLASGRTITVANEPEALGQALAVQDRAVGPSRARGRRCSRRARAACCWS